MNNPTVRLFTVENISKKRLRVGIASSLPDELQIFSIDKAAPIARSEAPRVPVVGSSAAATEAGSTDYLDLASSIQAASGREGGSKNSPARPPSRAKQAQRLVSRHGADRGITALVAATGTSATPTEIPSTTAVDFSRAFPNFDEDDEKSTGKNLKAGGDEPAASGDFSDNDQLSSALQQSAFGTRKSHDVTPASLQMLLNSLESASKHSMIFGKQASEERYLKAVLAMNKMLTKSRANGKLVPVTSLDMAPDSSEVLALVFTPSSTLRPYIQGKPKKLDAKILLRLLEFDRDATQAPEFEALLNAELESIPVREFIIRAALCRSLMEIGQRHINFGLMEKREQRSKTIVIYNRADVPLLYAIRKTGSIASGDLNFDGGRLGIVRGLGILSWWRLCAGNSLPANIHPGKREVKFTFTPSMPGNFLEKITIENLQDPENTQTVGVKAQIRKPSTFFVKSLDMDFGVFLANESTHSMQQIVITNTSKQTRTFELLVLAKDLVFGQCYGEMFFDAVDSVAHQPWSKETEEEIERMWDLFLGGFMGSQSHESLTRHPRADLEQKLKIAIRKGQDDKVKKVTERLGKLKGVGSVTTPSDGPSQSRVEVDTAAPNAPTTISSSSSTAQLPKRPSSSSGRRLRTTDKGVVFSIDSLATITINVYLRIMSDARATDDNDRSMERCRGELVVNELRNADSAKTIRFQIMTCFDYAAYVHALEGHAPDLRMLSNDAIAASRPASPRMSRNASAFQVTAPCMTASTVTSPLGTPAVATALMGLATILKPLEVCPAILDLGKIELSASSSYYLMLNNPSEKSIEYFVRVPSDSRIILKEPPRGRVGPLESKRVYFSLRPSDFGKQTDALVIVDRTNRVEVEFTVAYHALQNRYLVFDGLAVTGDIDFGVCYLDSSKQYCKSIAIAVRNASTEPIFVAVRSNLVQQLYLFSDRELKCPLSRFQLDIDQVQRIYLAIQPNVTAAALKNGDCRELVGGLKFSVSSVVTDPTTSTPVENEFLVSQTIRFVALVGESTIETSVTDFDFGVATALDTFEGHFVVSNVCYREMVDSSSFVTQRHLSTQPSQYLPLEVEIQCPDSVIVSEKAITLYGTDATSTSSAKIDFSLSPKTWGLFEEEIRLLNLHNPGQVRIISLRVFIDPGLLIIRPQRKTNLFASVEYVQYYWPQLYVNAIDSEPRVVCVDGGGDDKLITVTNDSDRPLIFDVMSPPFVEFALATKTGAVGMDQSMRQSANRIALEPGETIPLRMLAHAPKSFRSYEVKALRRGAPAIARGMVRLVEIGSGGTIGVIKLMANFYLARAQIEPPLMDLGRLGLSGRLEDVPIKFAIKNVTDAPFPFELPDEGAIEITAVFCRNRLLLVAGQHALVIPPRETFDVEARLKAHKLEFVSSAVQTFEFTMKNLGNPREPLRISFKASISMLQLQFGRLTNGELVLPPLQIPQPAEATPCDAWFTIVNTSNEDARFEVGLDLAPELSDMFSVEVLSRFSNAKLKGVITLCAQGVLEVKVRAAIKAESRRLSEVSQNITSPDGVALGRLRVAVRLPGGGDDASSVCEDVPLRGTFIEGPPFVLSKQRIEFRCAPEPDSSDHESDDEGNGRSSKEPPSSRQVAADDMHTSTSHTADVVKIMNLSPAYPLVFRVQQELPPALKDSDYIKVSPIDKEGMGTVPPGGTLELSVELSRVTPAGSFDIKLHIEDANAIARRKEVVVIAVSSEAPRRRHPTATTIFSQTTAPARSDDHAPKSEEPIAEQPIATLSASPMKSALSVQALEEKMSSNRVKIPIGPGIALRGCKQMSFRGSGGAAANGTGLRYEIDVGQQDVGAGTVTRILILENEATRPSRYRIRTTFSGVERAEPWLTLSKTEGLLDPRPDNGRDVGNETENVVQRSSLGLGETHIQQVHVFLSCTTEGCYTAYLFIENEDNPADTKLIRVTMEVPGENDEMYFRLTNLFDLHPRLSQH